MKAMIELVVGDLDGKRTYHQINKRAKKLPGNYYRAFKKIRNYLYNYGENCADSEVFLELFSTKSGKIRFKNAFFHFFLDKFLILYYNMIDIVMKERKRLFVKG